MFNILAQLRYSLSLMFFFSGGLGGSSNAYTSSEHTNFHFDIPCGGFVDALQRFVSFFECPIFGETAVQNELEIVQSEHEKNRFNDVWRTNQVIKLSIASKLRVIPF